MKKNGNRKGIWIPQELIDDHKLDWSNKIIMAEIINLSKLEKGCHASNEHFAQLLGVNKSSASKRLTKLQELNYIISNNIYEGVRCVGRIIQLVDKNSETNNLDMDSGSTENPDIINYTLGNSHKKQDVVPEPQGSSSVEDGLVVPESPDGASGEKPNNTINKIKYNNTDIYTSAGAEKSTFDNFVNYYLNSISGARYTEDQFKECLDAFFYDCDKCRNELHSTKDIASFLHQHRPYLLAEALEWSKDPAYPEDTQESLYLWFNEVIVGYYYAHIISTRD